MLDQCPECGSSKVTEAMEEGEFKVGRRKPVTLKVVQPVLTCGDCGCKVTDWRGEKARALAMSEYMKSLHTDLTVPDAIQRRLHAFSSMHKQQLEHFGRAGCFYCLQSFNTTEIKDWVDEGQTALCPKCMIDSVVPLTEEITPEVLKAMQQWWFAHV